MLNVSINKNFLHKNAYNNFFFQSGIETVEVAQEIYHLQSMIEEEEQKALKFKQENIRRKHNYLPFIVELLKILASDGRLVPLMKQV